MTTTAVCDFSELPVDQCSHCLGDRPEPDKAERLGCVIEAKWPGECGHCGDRIESGDAIVLAITDPGPEARWCIAEHTS